MKREHKSITAQLLRRGWSYERIAQRLGMSVATLKEQACREGLTHFDRADFMPLSVLAAELNVSTRALQERVQKGQVGHVRHGRLVGFTQEQAQVARALIEGIPERQLGWWTTQEAARRTGYSDSGFIDAARRAGLQPRKARSQVKSITLMWLPEEALSVRRKGKAA